MEQNYNNKLDKEELKANYISTIVSLLNKCNDIGLLDLIQKLLEKSI